MLEVLLYILGYLFVGFLICVATVIIGGEKVDLNDETEQKMVAFIMFMWPLALVMGGICFAPKLVGLSVNKAADWLRNALK